MSWDSLDGPPTMSGPSALVPCDVRKSVESLISQVKLDQDILKESITVALAQDYKSVCAQINTMRRTQSQVVNSLAVTEQ